MIINVPSNLEKHTTHRYSKNSFKLHRLPIPRPGEVLGLVGQNGIGKSTALKILAGKQKPNLGRYSDPPDWTEILTYFRGSELQNYFTKILEDDLKALIKPQYVDQIPRAVKGTVGFLLNKRDDRKNQDEICQMLDLTHIKDREIQALSGGELQRFAISMVCIQDGDIFMFDEPSSYLDVRQRLNAALTIRHLIHPTKSVQLHKTNSVVILTLIRLPFSDSSLSLNMICQSWIISQISSAACMACPVVMVSLLCHSQFVKVSTFSWMDLFPLRICVSELNR